MTQPAPRMVNDITPQPTVPQASATPQTLTTSIVNDIPVRAPAHPMAQQPLNEDDELDKIMQDVGQQLRQAERHTPKKHMFSLGRSKPKPLPASSAKPVLTSSPDPAPQAQPPAGQVAAAISKPALVATGRSSSAPVLVIMFTIAVTAVLAAAAIYTYRLS